MFTNKNDNLKKRGCVLRSSFVGAKKGFTLVELLVSISILATISIVGYVSAHSYTMKANNSRRITSMDTLKTSLNNYYQIKKTLPEPDTNRVYYDERGTYMHSSTGSYGVSGHASRHWYSEDYANNFAFDPETKQFFGYGKLSDNSAFDIATALYVDTGIYKTYLDGTYDSRQLPSLIRSYHSSDFVVQDSTELLPYDPFERRVTAKIVTYSGTITPVIWAGSMNGTNCVSSPTLSLTGELMTGDCIGVGTGSYALLHISDGSELSLGSTGSTTVLELKDLRFKDSEDPVTSVLLRLISGEVWSEAPRLRKINENESEMQIYTTTALAAVRGTVFGVSVSSTGVTNLSLAAGQIDVGRNPVISNGIPLVGSVSVTSSPFGSTDGFSTTATGGYVLSGSTSSMIVPDGGKPIVLSVPPTVSGHESETSIPASTGSIDSSTLQQKLHFIPFGLGYRPVVTDISFTGAIISGVINTQTGILSMTFENPGADSYRVSFGTGEWDDIRLGTDHMSFITGALNAGQPIMTVTGAFARFPLVAGQGRVVSLKLCYQNQCSAPYITEVAVDTFDIHNTTRRSDRKLDCAHGQRQFARFGCQPKELVAFAPYDRPSDVLMYTSRGGSLGFSTNRIIGSGSYAYHDDAGYALNAIRGFTTYKNTCVPILSTTTMAFASATCASIDTMTASLNDLASKGFRFDVPNSFFDIPQVGSPAVRGVLIENSGNTDYLKYDLSALELGDKFAIEVSVRGAALKRGIGEYFLFNSDDNLYLKNHNGKFKFGYYNGDTLVSNGNWRSIYETIDVSNINFDPNYFYRVQLSVFGSPISKNNTTIKILDGNNNDLINGSSIGTCTIPGGCTTIKSINNLFIGSRNANTYNTPTCSSSISCQWNDIIDSIKIYRQ